MKKRISILMKDPKYLESLKNFLISRIEGCECVAASKIKDLTTINLSEQNIIIISSLISEGIWLKALPIVRKAQSFVLLGMAEGPEITEAIAEKYGAAAFFKLPLNSELFLAKINEILLEIEKNIKIPKIITKDFIETIAAFYEKMENLNYYEFFNLPRDATLSEIKKKYIATARKYHPDKFRNAPSEIKDRAYEITKRSNEAYSVLTNPSRKVIYDKMLLENPQLKRFDFRIKVSYNANPEDTIQNTQARRFVLLAKRAMECGDYMSALTQLKMASSMEKNNAYLAKLLAEVSEELEKQK